MAVRREIRFLLNDTEVRLADVAATDTLLNHFRLAQRLTGTKEGCAEGDCGACTVLVGRRAKGTMTYEPVNACIRLLASVDLCHVVTVEHLARGGTLAPVQQAMVSHHGSQCGFCTPGIVMSLHALWLARPDPTVEEVETALQGNLCRCTGYRPIIDAARNVSGDPATDPLMVEGPRIAALLDALDDDARVELGRGGSRAILPAEVDDLAEVLASEPDATVVAGMTDVGLWVTKAMRDISPAVFVGHLEELREVAVSDAGLTIGAGATYADAAPAMAQMFPHLAAYWNRIGGWQVRNMGTIGGNIANGSPIGDTPPVLIALGTTLTLRKGQERRVMPLEDFFLDYGKQDRQPGEFVESVHVARPAAGSLHAAYKISKRRDEDISALACGIAVMLEGDCVREARIAFGGMAATPRRAAQAEAALIGQVWSEAAVETAKTALTEDFAPISDWRAGAEYRMKVARNLLTRFWLESRGETSQLDRGAA